MLIAFLAAAGAAIVVLTFGGTAAGYASLPERVPLHFSLDGTVDGYGPRPMVWVTAVLQFACAALFAWILVTFVRQGIPVRIVVAMAAFADIMLLLLWRAQRLIIETALSGRTRVELKSFWWFFAATMLSAIGLVTIVSR